jgi:hypothetical protein
MVSEVKSEEHTKNILTTSGALVAGSSAAGLAVVAGLARLALMVGET